MNMADWSRGWAVAGLALLTAACASLPVTPEQPAEQSWLERQAAMACIDEWQFRGRMALAAEGEGWNASIDWRQRGEQYRMHLSGPFGSGGMRLVGDPHNFRLEQGGESYTHFGPPEELIEAEIGVAIPVSGLRHWVLGMPQPEQPSEYTLNAAGQLNTLQQAGWDIRYDTYRDYDGTVLPRVMIMERPGVRMRLVSGNWQIGDTADCEH